MLAAGDCKKCTPRATRIGVAAGLLALRGEDWAAVLNVIHGHFFLQHSDLVTRGGPNESYLFLFSLIYITHHLQ